jgi:hypothetical protein
MVDVQDVLKVKCPDKLKGLIIGSILPEHWCIDNLILKPIL